MPSPETPSPRRASAAVWKRLAKWSVAAGAAAAAYLLYEAQAVECQVRELAVPGLPRAWSGTTVLHISDVHAGVFPTNERSLRKAVRWASGQQPDLVFLTGDILGEAARSRTCLEWLSRLRPPLGIFAVTGNHEYGLGKGPLARARRAAVLWEGTGVILLSDSCHLLPARGGTTLAVCGADYLTSGSSLIAPARTDSVFPILLVHEPPLLHSPLASQFPLVFAGHTHGGQLRIPGRHGLRPLYDDTRYEGGSGPARVDSGTASATGTDGRGTRLTGGHLLGPRLAGADDHAVRPPGTDLPPYSGPPRSLAGIYRWGNGVLVISRGLGTSFLPFRLLTRPEATIWRLV